MSSGDSSVTYTFVHTRVYDMHYILYAMRVTKEFRKNRLKKKVSKKKFCRHIRAQKPIRSRRRSQYYLCGHVEMRPTEFVLNIVAVYTRSISPSTLLNAPCASV